MLTSGRSHSCGLVRGELPVDRFEVGEMLRRVEPPTSERSAPRSRRDDTVRHPPSRARSSRTDRSSSPGRHSQARTAGHEFGQAPHARKRAVDGRPQEPREPPRLACLLPDGRYRDVPCSGHQLADLVVRPPTQESRVERAEACGRDPRALAVEARLRRSGREDPRRDERCEENI